MRTSTSLPCTSGAFLRMRTCVRQATRCQVLPPMPARGRLRRLRKADAVRLMSNRPKQNVTRNPRSPVCNAARQLVGWTDTARCCQISLAQQCMSSPTVGRANVLARRAHQSAELTLTFLSIPPEQLRFVIHTDCSSKDQDGDWTDAEWVHYWSDQPVSGSGTRGAVGTTGVAVAQAETKMHVNSRRSQSVWKSGTRTTSGSQPSVSSTA